MTELYVGKIVYFPYLDEFVEVVAVQEHLETGEIDLVLETPAGVLYEACGYEVQDV